MIYRGIVCNWCPNDQTVLSDLEVQKESATGKALLSSLPCKNGSAESQSQPLRPETMLGDTAVAVNPNDERYRHLRCGATILTSTSTGREIPWSRMSLLTPQFGTGQLRLPLLMILTITMGLRHQSRASRSNRRAGKNDRSCGVKLRRIDRYKARRKW